MPTTIVGRQTQGKFCSGLLRRATDWYESNAEQLGSLAAGKEYVGGWGIYVMFSRFADRNGVTRCMPNGLEPDYAVRDNPFDGYGLGDPRETMLAATLSLIDGASPAPAQLRARTPAPEPLPLALPAFRIVSQD